MIHDQQIGGRCPNGRFYTIQSGDTLFNISRRFNVSLDDLVSANPNIDFDILNINDTLCIPNRNFNNDFFPNRCRRFYTVRAGDTIFRIARRFNTSVQQLLFSNPNLNPQRLRIGQRICIPTSGQSRPIQRPLPRPRPQPQRPERPRQPERPERPERPRNTAESSELTGNVENYSQKFQSNDENYEFSDDFENYTEVLSNEEFANPLDEISSENHRNFDCDDDNNTEDELEDIENIEEIEGIEDIDDIEEIFEDDDNEDAPENDDFYSPCPRTRPRPCPRSRMRPRRGRGCPEEREERYFDEVTLPGCDGRVYVIKEGDTFFKIARRYNYRLETLLDANSDLDPENLQIGALICLPRR